jgi:ABC-type enterobactin transport system permease subunit
MRTLGSGLGYTWGRAIPLIRTRTATQRTRTATITPIIILMRTVTRMDIGADMVDSTVGIGVDMDTADTVAIAADIAAATLAVREAFPVAPVVLVAAPEVGAAPEVVADTGSPIR